MRRILFNSRSGPMAFLSNFHAALIDYEGIRYPSVEHAYQAAKTLDLDKRLWIAQAPSPCEARRRGRNVQLRPGWPALRVPIMGALLIQKFTDQKLREKLLATGNTFLVHEARWDSYWGNGADRRGLNVLGKLIMGVRRRLMAELKADDESVLSALAAEPHTPALCRS